MGPGGRARLAWVALGWGGSAGWLGLGRVVLARLGWVGTGWAGLACAVLGWGGSAGLAWVIMGQVGLGVLGFYSCAPAPFFTPSLCRRDASSASPCFALPAL